MDRAYLETLRIQGYGCIRDATLRLTPLHALIGPNDSGKSTVLRAIETLGAFVTGSVSPEVDRELARAAKDGALCFISETGGQAWTLALGENGYEETISGPEGDVKKPLERLGKSMVRASGSRGNALVVQDFFAAFGLGARTFGLEPRSLRQPSQLVPEGSPIVLDRHGHGLAAAYDAILSRDIDAFSEIKKQLVSLFPTVKQLQLFNPSEGGKALRIELTDKTLVDANYMSEGLLLYLAFAALPYIAPSSILLLEEPENGLHPARIQQVMGLLRELSKTTQVILATHSPLVINELQGDEVSVLTRESPVEGTQVQRLKDTPRFDERSKVYALGELWVSYANGSDEGPLLTGGARP